MTYDAINDATVFDAVVLAAGSFPTHSVPLAALRHAACLCCCDSAALMAVGHGFQPDAIVGDADSLPSTYRRLWADRVHTVAEQADNDLTKATHFIAKRLAAQGAASRRLRVAYVGATGRRDDHSLGNIALMPLYYKEHGILPTMITDYGWFVVAEGCNSFATFAGQQVSVFNVGCTRLRSSGLKWPVYPFTQLWQGTLNEATGSSVEIEGDGIYMAYFTFEAKKPVF